jgi:hypothetical protein
MIAAILALMPLLAKLGLFFIGKFIAKDAASAEKAARLNKQWLDTLHDIAAGLQESIEISDRYSAARKRLDDKFNKMKGNI